MRLFLLVTLLLISACTYRTEHKAQIKPESLLTSNTEDISFSITGRESLDAMFKWVLDDRPSEAALYCADGDPMCVGAEKILNNFQVPYNMKMVSHNESSVSLMYNRVLKKNCTKGIGCATSANIIGAITDRTDFTNPALSDYQDAQKAVETYNRY